jgi:hypothetical protein
MILKIFPIIAQQLGRSGMLCKHISGGGRTIGFSLPTFRWGSSVVVEANMMFKTGTYKSLVFRRNSRMDQPRRLKIPDKIINYL